jgi:hypothetical protein
VLPRGREGSPFRPSVLSTTPSGLGSCWAVKICLQFGGRPVRTKDEQPRGPHVRGSRELGLGGTNQRFCQFRRTTIFDILYKLNKRSQRTKSQYKQWTNIKRCNRSKQEIAKARTDCTAVETRQVSSVGWRASKESPKTDASRQHSQTFAGGRYRRRKDAVTLVRACRGG